MNSEAALTRTHRCFDSAAFPMGTHDFNDIGPRQIRSDRRVPNKRIRTRHSNLSRAHLQVFVSGPCTDAFRCPNFAASFSRTPTDSPTDQSRISQLTVKLKEHCWPSMIPQTPGVITGAASRRKPVPILPKQGFSAHAREKATSKWQEDDTDEGI